MTATEVSTLSIAALGVVVAILALPRRTQLWALPTTVIILLILLALPVKQLSDQRPWVVTGALGLAGLALGAWRLVVWARERPPKPIFFEVDSIADGATITDHDVPLTITGTYSGNAAGVRVVLQDANRQYYLQHPEVEMRAGGLWTAVNIRPGSGIERIIFLQVGSLAKRHFDGLADAGRWGSLGGALPPNVQPLVAVTIVRN